MRQNWTRRFADPPAARFYLIYEALHAAALGTIIPLFAIYFRFAHLSLLDIALLAFIFEGTILIFEIPTGTAADLLGRVNAMRAGSGLLFLAGLLFIFSRSLEWFIAAEILCGVGEASRSGSAAAWVSGKLDESDSAGDISRLFARRVKFNFAATFVAMLVGGLIGQYFIAGSWLLFTLLCLGALGITLLMSEPHLERAHVGRIGLRTFWTHTLSGLNHLRSSRRLIAVLMLVLTANFAYEGLDQYWQVFLDEGLNASVTWFGLMTASTALILFLIADKLVPWFYHKLGMIRPILVLGVTSTAALSLFALLHPFLVVFVAFVLFAVARGLQEPLLTAYIAEKTPANLRATVLSTQNLFSSSGEMIAALTAGLIASALGLPPLFVIGAVVLLAGILLFTAMFGKTEPDAPPDAAIEK